MSIDWPKVAESLPRNSVPLLVQVQKTYESCPDDPEAGVREVDKMLLGVLASLRGRFDDLKREAQG